MGYGLWFDVSHLDATVVAISETPVGAVFLRHSEGKYLFVFKKPAGADEANLLRENDKFKLSFTVRVKKSPSEFGSPLVSSNETNAAENQNDWQERILPRTANIPPHLVSNSTV